MVIREYGTDKSRHLLFFQGSCEPWKEFEPAAKLLAKKFHVMLLTQDGHDPEEHTDFISVEKTVDDAAEWLKGHAIVHLDALYGLSFGGGMVIRFLTTQDIPVDKAIIDAGTAPYQYPKWLCKLICVRDYLMVKLGVLSVKGMKMAFPPDRFARDPANWEQEYREIQDYMKTYSNKTIWNIFWSANNYAVPEPVPKIDTEIRFWVGEDEWGSRYRDLKWAKKYLPQIKVVRIPHMMHGEYVMMHPEKFARRALAFLRSFLYDSNIGTRQKAGERKDTSM